jgi:hypothetical protein
MSVIDAITLAIAILGAVLGIISTWHSFDARRVKIKVIPAHAIPFGGVDERLRFCIQITNLSSFPITIDEAGVFYAGLESRGAIISPVFSDGGGWPRCLEPRTSVTVYSQLPYDNEGHKIKCAYALTQCGVICRGKSKALDQISKLQ